MAVISQRTAYWMDMYRCEGPDFGHYNVDSYISFIQIGVDEASGRRVGDTPPKLGWSKAGEIIYTLDSGASVIKDVTQRARGGIYVEQSTPVNQVIRLLEAYWTNIDDRPPFEYDIDCVASSSSVSEISISETVISSSLVFYSSSSIVESSSSIVESSATESLPSGYDSSSLAGISDSSTVAGSSLEESSSAYDLCTLLGCPGATYAESVGTGATELLAIEDFSSSAEELCNANEQTVCVSEVLSTQEIIPSVLWVASGRVCCAPLAQVDVSFELQLNTNEGVQSWFITPGNNPQPLGIETTLTDFTVSGSSSSMGEFPLPNTVVSVIWDSEYPNRACLIDNVSNLEIFGEFSNPGTLSAVLTYRSNFSDLLGGGRAYFHNSDGGLPSLIRLDSLVITIDYCATSSSSGG